MRRALRLLTIMLLWVALPLLAAAQGQDPLQRHATALENLSRSVGLLASDSTASLDALESAAGSLRLLTGDTTSTTLVAAMEQQFDSARAAIGNRSEADLAVQVAVLRGGFQRALLEASLKSDNLDAARAGFDQLAAELSLDTEALDALAGAGSLAGLLDGYRAGVARGIADRLAVVRQQFPADSAAAYVTLAGAYGMSLSIQDAEQTPAGLNAEFGGLIGAVVAGDGDAVELLAAGLQQQLAALGTSGAAVPAPAPDATAETAVAEEAAAQPEDATVQDSPEPAAASEAADPLAAAPEAAAAVTDGERPAEPAALPAAPALANLVDLQEVTVADETLNSLLADLGRRGLRGQAGENLAGQLQARGFTSFGQVIDEALALAGRAGAAVAHGGRPRPTGADRNMVGGYAHAVQRHHGSDRLALSVGQFANVLL